MHIFSAVALLVSTVQLGSALGINCRGSGNCLGIAGNIDDLIKYADKLKDYQIFTKDKHIVCQKSQLGNGLCAFPQDTFAVTGAQVKKLLRSLKDHHCKKCGSVPVGYPGSNDPTNGILKVNAVGPGLSCNGVC
ncbi:hypothetical protein NQ176_g3820 [Zarea fungicola]|uniref:Uncharacterized protein n=1 Tax=Zarea fungicola TaxID=93591 RepID=A0ACC1NHL3_9HYPO|nr:hypothetical protein NQ176_g3820 [Lecanicillium fungicola]